MQRQVVEDAENSAAPQMREQRVTDSHANLPTIPVGPVPSITPPRVAPEVSGPMSLSGQVAVGASAEPQPDEEGFLSTRTLILGALALVLVGAATTTAIMVPWSFGSRGSVPVVPSASVSSAPTATAVPSSAAADAAVDPGATAKPSSSLPVTPPRKDINKNR